jgi:hypothetical protein
MNPISRSADLILRGLPLRPLLRLLILEFGHTNSLDDISAALKNDMVLELQMFVV